MNIIKKYYYGTKTGFQSAEKMYQKLKNYGIKLQQIKDFLKSQETYQLHKSVKKVSNYFPIYATHRSEIFQIDLMDLSNISNYNNGYKYLLICIDVRTRFVYIRPLKNKFSTTVNEAMKSILNIEKPEKIQADRGSEFINYNFKKLLENNNIHIQFLESSHKLGIINRFCRTIRSMIEKYLTAYKTNNYINVLNDLVENYNSSYHKGIKSSPNNPNEKLIDQINLKKYFKAKEEETKFVLEDNVRFIRNKKAFEKGSLPHYSSTIHHVIDNDEHSYKLDNNKWYLYYELIKISDVQVAPDRINVQRERIDNKRKRILAREGIDEKNIINHPRQKKKSKRLSPNIVLPGSFLMRPRRSKVEKMDCF